MVSRRRYIKTLISLFLGGIIGYHYLYRFLLGKSKVIVGKKLPFSVSGDFKFEIFSTAMAQPLQVRRKWKRHWVMIIDLERCDGCALCTASCNIEHGVPNGQTWIKIYVIKETPLRVTYFLPRPCMQCENAPCVKVCPVGANYYNEDGVVMIDKNRCIGCRLCMAACPYGARYFNWENLSFPAERNEEHYPESYHPRGVVEKCMFCVMELNKGKLPPCVLGCKMRALYMGDLYEDAASNGVETVKISELLSKRFSFRLFEELGTEPRVIYLAPLKSKPSITYPLKP